MYFMYMIHNAYFIRVWRYQHQRVKSHVSRVHRIKKKWYFDFELFLRYIFLSTFFPPPTFFSLPSTWYKITPQRSAPGKTSVYSRLVLDGEPNAGEPNAGEFRVVQNSTHFIY
jgi:hypothetical protein